MALHSRDYAKLGDSRELSVFRVLLKSHACEKRTILTIRLMLLRCRQVLARLLKCEESNLLWLKVLRSLLVAREKDSADSHFLYRRILHGSSSVDISKLRKTPIVTFFVSISLTHTSI